MLEMPARVRTSVSGTMSCLPHDAQNNPETICIVVHGWVFWRDGCTQSMTHMPITGQLAPQPCIPLAWCIG